MKKNFKFFILLLLSLVGFYFITVFHIQVEIYPSIEGIKEVHGFSDPQALQYYIDGGRLDFWLITAVIPFLLYICSYSYHHYCISAKHDPLQRISAWALSIPKKIPLNKYLKVLLFFFIYIPLWYYFIICSITNVAVIFLFLPVLLFAVHIVYHWLYQFVSRLHIHSLIKKLFLLCIFWLTLLFYSIEDVVLFVIILITFFFPYIWIPFHYYIAVKAGSAFCNLSHRG